jgi:DNA-binding transcriptional regulator GbsR (MarR family)
MTKIPKEIFEKLQSLGLSEREARLYTTLFTAETPLGAGALVTQTGWHRQYVYTSLRELESLGLVQSVTVRGRQKFSIVGNDALLLLASQRQSVAKTVTEELLKLVKRERAQDFQVFQGTDSFVQHEFKELELSSEGALWRIIGCDGDLFDEVMGSELEAFDHLRDKKSLQIRYIGAPAQKAALEKIKLNRPCFDYRIVPDFNDSSCVTLIREKSVSTRSYSKPVLNYELYSESAALGQHNFFDALWRMCE